METELDYLRQEMLDAFQVMDSETVELRRATACQLLRDCLSQAHELGFEVTIRFSQGQREIDFVKTTKGMTRNTPRSIATF
jgi:hypothetical protein